VGYGYGIEKKAIATGLNLWSGIFSKMFGCGPLVVRMFQFFSIAPAMARRNIPKSLVSPTPGHKKYFHNQGRKTLVMKVFMGEGQWC
jgi:hypothetical protein